MPDEDGKAWLGGAPVAAGAIVAPITDVDFRVDGEEIIFHGGTWGVGRILPESLNFEEVLEAAEKTPWMFTDMKTKRLTTEPKRKGRGDII